MNDAFIIVFINFFNKCACNEKTRKYSYKINALYHLAPNFFGFWDFIMIKNFVFYINPDEKVYTKDDPYILWGYTI